MALITKDKSSPSRPVSPTLVAAGVVGITLLILGFVLYGIATFQVPPLKIAVVGLHPIKDSALPNIVITPPGHAALQGVPFDNFDFQALDPKTGLIFITHAGPSVNKQALLKNQLPPGTRFQSQVVVFDIKRQAVVGHVDIPDVHGIVIAPDLGRVYAADVTDDRIYVIDEHSFHIIATIPLGLQPCATPPCEKPDALEYDAVDHKLFVSDNGADPVHQDIGVIDVQTNQFVAAIPLGQDQWGDSIGHLQYDATSHHLFVSVQPLAAPPPPTPAGVSVTPTPAPVVLPPARFLVIDPVSFQVLNHQTFADTHACSDAHGMVVDASQHVAFIACVSTHTLMMINLQTMKLSGPWPLVLKPDILRLDLGVHRLYVPGSAGVSIFDEHGAASGTIKKLGDFVVIKGTTSHTMSVDPGTHILYFAIEDAQNKPLLRSVQYASA